MAEIFLFRMRPRRLETDRIAQMAERLGIDGKPIETEEAIAVRDKERVLAYAQPGSKFGGLLYYTDQSQSVAELIDKPLDVELAQAWADDFVRGFELLPVPADDERIRLNIELHSYQTNAVVDDGREQRKHPLKTEIGSKIELNGVPVAGPRGKVRMVFKDRKAPATIHCCLWERLEVYDTREQLQADEVIQATGERLRWREGREIQYEVKKVNLAYFAREYEGGADLLSPCFFVEVEFEDRTGKKLGIEEGPLQLFCVPAYR